MNTYEENIIIAEKFWQSPNDAKAKQLYEMLGRKEYAEVYNLILCARDIDKTFGKTFGDIFFDKFIALIDDVGISNFDIIPFLLYCITAFDVTAAWKECALAYLQHICRESYAEMIEYVTQSPSAIIWRALVNVLPEKTTDIMLEQLFESKTSNKVILREVLSETKLDIFPILEELYAEKDEQSTRVAVVRLLLMFKNDAVAIRLLQRIKAHEKSFTILSLLGANGGKLSFKYKVEFARDGAYSISRGKEYCRFLLTDGKIDLLSYTDKGEKFASKAIKSRSSYLSNAFMTGESIEMNIFSDTVRNDKLFALLCEKYLFCMYNINGYPYKLFTVKNGDVVGYECDIDTQSDELVTVAHPSELADSTLDIPKDLYSEQLKRDCFLPSKDELRLSKMPAFSGIMVAQDLALKRASKMKLKIAVSDDQDYNYFSIKWGNFYCVYTFTAHKNAVSLGTAQFYDYSKLSVSGSKVILKGSMPMTLRDVPTRIFSEFLSRVYYIVRGSGIQ